MGWALLGAAGTTAHALIFVSTGDPQFNTTAPTGALQDSGWQYQGFWGGFLGTPVASNLFLSAAHVGGSVGQEFLLQGQRFVTIAFFDDPDSDLRLWQICGSFSAVAPVLTNQVEVGSNIVLFGRGTQRGAEVRRTNQLGSELKGWFWGPADSVLRWGENRVTQVSSGSQLGGATGVGDLLVARFDADGGVNEAIVSAGDSAGGMFLQENGVWKLAGIHYGVDGPFSRESGGEPFEAALLDRGGFYGVNGETYTWVPDTGANRPSGTYATRVSSHWTWLQRIIAAAAANPDAVAVQIADRPDGPFLEDSGAVVDGVAGTVALSSGGEAQFYRLKACRLLRINGVRFSNGQTVLSFVPASP